MHCAFAQEPSLWLKPDCGSRLLRQLYCAIWNTISAQYLICLILELCRPVVMREEGATKLLKCLEAIKSASAAYSSLIKRMTERLKALNVTHQQALQRHAIITIPDFAIGASLIAAFNRAYSFLKHAVAYELRLAMAWLGLFSAKHQAVLPWALAEAIESVALRSFKIPPDNAHSIDQCARQAQPTSQSGMIGLRARSMTAPPVEIKCLNACKNDRGGLQNAILNKSIEVVRR